MNQSAFRAALLDPDRPTPPGVTDPEGRPTGCRFDVYRNNVIASLTEALRQAFPVIRKLVGEEFFTAMAIEHVRAHPPRSPMLMLYGADMPGFLAAFPPVAHLGYLPDIARLELALREAYHASDAAPVPADRLAALPDAEFLSARISFAPAMRIVQSRWPIHAIWAANAEGAPMPPLSPPTASPRCPRQISFRPGSASPPRCVLCNPDGRSMRSGPRMRKARRCRVKGGPRTW